MACPPDRDGRSGRAALPYWAVAWAGGLAIGRYLRELPEAVTGRRVFDVASGSGLCAIASMRAGAAVATGADIDDFAGAAIELNARANGHRVGVVRRDVLDEEPPDVDIILAGDCWYDAHLARRMQRWLHQARDRGIDVLIGDPGRRFLPADQLVELASYDVRTTTELENLDLKHGRVYSLRPAGESWKRFCHWEAPTKEAVVEVFEKYEIPYEAIHEVRRFDPATGEMEPATIDVATLHPA